MIFGHKKTLRSGHPAWDGLCFNVHDPKIPEPIRQSAAALAQPGWTLCFADTETGGEWWLFDNCGELVEAFWLEA